MTKDVCEQVSAVECGPYDYSRSGNPTRTQLEAHVAQLEARLSSPLSSVFIIFWDIPMKIALACVPLGLQLSAWCESSLECGGALQGALQTVACY